MTDVVNVEQINAVYLKVTADPGTRQEIQQFFSFRPNNYQFTPAYKNRMWDGKIRLYDLRKKQIYAGLYKYLIEFANARNYEFIVEDNSMYGRPDIEELHDIESLLKQVTLTANGDSITPRDYQLSALSHALTNKSSLLLSPTASGKSLIIYLAVRYFLEMYDRNVLLIVPTTSLVEQMYSDFGDYSTNDEWSVESNCHKIYSGKEKYNLKHRVIITTWQSIYKMQTPWFENYGMVIGDEAHNFKAKSLTAILEKCVNAQYRLGTTGTLDGTQTHQLVLEGLFGPVHKVTTTKKLIEENSLSQLDIFVLLLKYGDEYCKLVSKMKYQDEMSVEMIRQQLNLSASAVKMRLKRARDRLRKLYQNTHGKRETL